jgi:hypothetical protein
MEFSVGVSFSNKNDTFNDAFQRRKKNDPHGPHEGRRPCILYGLDNQTMHQTGQNTHLNVFSCERLCMVASKKLYQVFCFKARLKILPVLTREPYCLTAFY